jgi:hypothetical protein
MRFGIACFVVGVALATGLIAFGVARWWRVVLFVPFALGAVGVVQAREKT